MVGGWQQPSREVLVGMIEMLKVAMYSIRRSGSVRPILIVIPRSVVTEEVWTASTEKDTILRTPLWMGVEVVWVEDVLDSMDEQWRMSLVDTHSKGRMYKKLGVFNLTEWDTVIYLDADQIILRNIDVLFDTWPLPAFVINSSGSVNPLPYSYFTMSLHYLLNLLIGPVVLNSGMFVFQPNASQLVHMRDKLSQGVQAYADGNQEFLSHFFHGNWYQIPSRLSLGKMNRGYGKDTLCGAAILHYFGVKPARCPNRTVDCNSKEGLFYSPILYTLWWQYHDMMIADGFFNS